MSLFRKNTPTSTPAQTPPEPEAALPPPPVVAQAQAQAQVTPPTQGATVDFDGVYNFGQVSGEDRDRVRRAEDLLAALPGKASHKREVVDATLRAFGVDAARILESANKEVRALESFLRASQEQAQHVLDQGDQRIAALEAEIESVRQIKARASSEQDARARQLNEEMTKVQRVLDFFGVEEIDSGEPDEPTDVSAGLGRRKPATPAPLKPPPAK